MRPRMEEIYKRKKLTLSIDPELFKGISILSSILTLNNQSRFVEDALYEWVFDSLLLSYHNVAIHLIDDIDGFSWVNENNETVQGGFDSINNALLWYRETRQKEL